MIVRAASSDDIPAVIELGVRMVKKSAFRDTTVHYGQCMNRLLRATSSRREKLFVAEHSGVIVGFLILCITMYWWSATESYALDDGIYAEHAGAGRALIRFGMAWAKINGCREVMISFNSRIDTERAVETLVKGNGFTRRGVNVSVPIGV